MKHILTYLFLITAFFAAAQDKIYLTDGECLKGKVTDITDDKIMFEANDAEKDYLIGTQTLYKHDILLIEYKNGSVELFSAPTENVVYTSDKSEGKKLKMNSQKHEPLNFGSLNTLALCNADISGFYERLTNGKRFGFGLMGAYNFNRYVSPPNLFLAILQNAKKNYDLGGFINYYPTHFRNRSTFYYGILWKYTAFTYTSMSEQKNGSSSVVIYTPASGSHLATIFTVGSHIKITKDFFIKTIAGLGGYNLRGDYRRQYNYQLGGSSNTSFLIKAYFGLNAGFTF